MKDEEMDKDEEKIEEAEEEKEKVKKGGEAGCSRGERDEGQRIEDEEKVDSK